MKKFGYDSVHKYTFEKSFQSKTFGRSVIKAVGKKEKGKTNPLEK